MGRWADSVYEQRFERGACVLLAEAVYAEAKSRGFRPSYWAVTGAFPWSRDEDVAAHLIVKIENVFLDIRGVRTKDEIVDQWGSDVVPYSGGLKRRTEKHGGPEYGRAACVADPDELARGLLDEYEDGKANDFW